jgi:hypothetical protein
LSVGGARFYCDRTLQPPEKSVTFSSGGADEWAANALHCGRIHTELRCNLATQLFGAAE